MIDTTTSEATWAAQFAAAGWEVTRLDKATWGPRARRATDTTARTFAHMPDLLITSAQGSMYWIDLAGGKPGYDYLPAQIEKVNAHKAWQDFTGIPVWHVWDTGHTADIDTIMRWGRPGRKDPNGHPGDGHPFLLVPVRQVTWARDWWELWEAA
jgi:hypothetical protein